MAQKHFLVKWEMDIFADTPREAAEKARAIQLDPTSVATVFDVLDVAAKPVGITTIDLELDDAPLAEN